MAENVRDLIEPRARNGHIDFMDAKSPVKPAPFVRETEALASIAISLKRIADTLCADRPSPAQ